MQDALSQSAVGSTRPDTIPRPSLLNRKTMWLLIFGAAVLGALAQTGLFREELVNGGGWPLALRFVEASLHPDLSPEFLWLTLDATLVTLAFAVSGTFLSLTLGVIGGIFASEVWWLSVLPRRQPGDWFRWFRIPWLGLRSGLAGLRAIHELIWGLFFINIIGLDPLTAILAIAIPFGAVTAKVFSEILDETDRGPLTALQNSGVSPLKAFTYTLLPQAFRDWLAYGFYRFECAIRAAAVLGIIGAGGLGYQIFLSLQTLRYEQIWTLFFALFLLNGLADFWSGLLRRRLGSTGPCIPGTYLDLDVIRPRPRRATLSWNDPVVRTSFIIAPILIVFSFWYLAPDLGRLFSHRTGQYLAEVSRAAFPPDLAAFPVGEWARLASITLSMSLLAVAGAGLFGLGLSFPAANNFLLPGGLLDSGGQGTIRQGAAVAALLGARAMLLVARSIPPPIWALILLYVLFPGILPGAVALGLYSMGVLGRLMAEATENLDERPLAALKAQGAGGGDMFAYGVLPATSARFLAYLLYRWEEAIRATVVVGLVGAGGLGRLLTEQLSSFDYQGVLATLIIFIGIIFAVDLISAAARQAFREA